MTAPGGPLTDVLIIDDHELVGRALAAQLTAHGLTARWTAPAHLDDCLAAREDRALALLDLDLGPDGAGRPLDGVDLVPRLRRSGHRVLVVTGSSDETRLARAVAAGAVGWAAKASPFDELVTTALRAAAGEILLAPAEHRRLRHVAADAAAHADDLHRRWNRLSTRERAVLAELAEGHRAEAIARNAVVALSTVRSQIRSILAKLEVTSQIEAVAIARGLPPQ